jgi:phosphotransacetylase
MYNASRTCINWIGNGVDKLKVVWDIDYTLIYSKDESQPARITLMDEPYINPVVIGREDEIKHLITGRYFKYRKVTEGLLIYFGIYNADILMNPLETYSEAWIAQMKSDHLRAINATHYVEDNPHYREVMCKYWDGECISSKEWVK